MVAMRVVVIPASLSEEVRIDEVKAVTLKYLQAQVHGWIERIPVNSHSDMWLNEEGKIELLPINARATLLVEDLLQGMDVIVGNVVITGREDAMGNSTGLSDDQVHWFNTGFEVE